MSDAVTLEDALRILEVRNLESLSVDDLGVLRRKAQKRWHPDTIAAIRADKATIERYSENFRRIDDAIAAVKTFLEEGVGSTVAPLGAVAEEMPSPPEPEEVIRRNAPSMQEQLRTAWATARKDMQTEEVVLSPGWSMAKLLHQDLDDDIPARVFAAWLGGVIPLLMLYDAGIRQTYYGLRAEWYVLPAGLAALVFTFLCGVMLIPLARFWLPLRVSTLFLYIVELGLLLYRGLYHLMRWTRVFGPLFWVAWLAYWLVMLLPVLIVRIFQATILRVAYLVAGAVLEGRYIGRAAEWHRIWHGLPEPAVDRLLNTDANELSREELFALSRLYGLATT